MMNIKLLGMSLRTLLLAAGALTMVTVLGACNTMEGFGEDTQRAGESIEKSAK